MATEMTLDPMQALDVIAAANPLFGSTGFVGGRGGGGGGGAPGVAAPKAAASGAPSGQPFATILADLIAQLTGGGDQASSGGARSVGQPGGNYGPLADSQRATLGLGLSPTGIGLSLAGLAAPGLGLGISGYKGMLDLGSFLASLAGVIPGFDPMLGAPTPSMVQDIADVFGIGSPQHDAAQKALTDALGLQAGITEAEQEAGSHGTGLGGPFAGTDYAGSSEQDPGAGPGGGSLGGSDMGGAADTGEGGGGLY